MFLKFIVFLVSAEHQLLPQVQIASAVISAGGSHQGCSWIPRDGASGDAAITGLLLGAIRQLHKKHLLGRSGRKSR